MSADTLEEAAHIYTWADWERTGRPVNKGEGKRKSSPSYAAQGRAV
ncbi:MAG TPA: hypothetical protein VH349_00995 [Ktedonobacterales bacterium]|jgi:hypothetical protein